MSIPGMSALQGNLPKQTVPDPLSPLPLLLKGSISSRITEKLPDCFPSLSLFLKTFVFLAAKVRFASYLL